MDIRLLKGGHRVVYDVYEAAILAVEPLGVKGAHTALRNKFGGHDLKTK